MLRQYRNVYMLPEHGTKQGCSSMDTSCELQRVCIYIIINKDRKTLFKFRIVFVFSNIHWNNRAWWWVYLQCWVYCSRWGSDAHIAYWHTGAACYWHLQPQSTLLNSSARLKQEREKVIVRVSKYSLPHLNEAWLSKINQYCSKGSDWTTLSQMKWLNYTMQDVTSDLFFGSWMIHPDDHIHVIRDLEASHSVQKQHFRGMGGGLDAPDRFGIKQPKHQPNMFRCN